MLLICILLADDGWFVVVTGLQYVASCVVSGE